MVDFFSGRVKKVTPDNYLKAMKDYPDWMIDVYVENLSWLNVLNEDPEKVSVRDVRRMRNRYEKSIEEIREELEYLKELIGEQKE